MVSDRIQLGQPLPSEGRAALQFLLVTRPAPDIVARVERLLGWAPETWRAVHGGYTPTARYAVANGTRTGFVKVATTIRALDLPR